MNKESSARQSRRCVRARDRRRGGKASALDAIPVLQWPAGVPVPPFIAEAPAQHDKDRLPGSGVPGDAMPLWVTARGPSPRKSAGPQSLIAANAQPSAANTANPASADEQASDQPSRTSLNSAEVAQPAECDNNGRKRSRTMTGDEIWAFNMLLGKIAEQIADPEDSRPSKRSCRRMTLQELFRKRKSERWDEIEEVVEEKPPPAYEPPPFLAMDTDNDEDEEEVVVLPVTSGAQLPEPIRYVSREEETLEVTRAEPPQRPTNKSKEELPTSSATHVPGPSICAGIRSSTQPSQSKAVSRIPRVGSHHLRTNASVVQQPSSDANLKSGNCATGRVAEATKQQGAAGAVAHAVKGAVVRQPHPSSNALCMLKEQQRACQKSLECSNKGTPGRRRLPMPAGTDAVDGVEPQGTTRRRSLRLAAAASDHCGKSDVGGASSVATAMNSPLVSPALRSKAHTPRTACRSSRLDSRAGQAVQLRDSFNHSTISEDSATAGARSSRLPNPGAIGVINKSGSCLPSCSNQEPVPVCGTPKTSLRVAGEPDPTDPDNVEWRWRTRRGAMVASGLTPGGPKSAMKSGLRTPSRQV